MSDIGSDPIRKFGYPKILDRGHSDPNPIRNFRISELFESDHRVFRSDTGFSDRITGFSDRITGFLERIPGFRIGSVEIFEKSQSVSDPKTRIFFRIPDP